MASFISLNILNIFIFEFVMLLYIKLYLQWSFVSIIDVFSLLYVRPRHVYWNLFVDSPWARVFLCLFSCVSPSFLSCVPLVSTWPLAPWVQGWVTFVHGYVSPEEMLGRGRFLGGAHERLGLAAEWGCCGFAPFTPGENTFWKSCSCRQEVGKHLVVLPVLTSRGTSLQCRCQVAAWMGPLSRGLLSPHSPQGQSPTTTACLLTRALARLLRVSGACLMCGDANLLSEYFQVLHGLSMIVTYLAQGGIFEVWPQNSIWVYYCRILSV